MYTPSSDKHVSVSPFSLPPLHYLQCASCGTVQACRDCDMPYAAVVLLQTRCCLQIDGHGNFGSVDSDPPAAMRYTECRLQHFSSATFLTDLDSDTVNFLPNFDASQVGHNCLHGYSMRSFGMRSRADDFWSSRVLQCSACLYQRAVGMTGWCCCKSGRDFASPTLHFMHLCGIPATNSRSVYSNAQLSLHITWGCMQQDEPTVLPARVPHLLVNGAAGIAVGIATKIPPHNLREVVAGLKALIHDPDITIAQLIQHIPGPDFPTGDTGSTEH